MNPDPPRKRALVPPLLRGLSFRPDAGGVPEGGRRSLDRRIAKPDHPSTPEGVAPFLASRRFRATADESKAPFSDGSQPPLMVASK